jgi:hypothetical protein
MSHDFFAFKQFTVRQSMAAMKVGEDGVLLGAWTDVLQDESFCGKKSKIHSNYSGTSKKEKMLEKKKILTFAPWKK